MSVVSCLVIKVPMRSDKRVKCVKDVPVNASVGKYNNGSSEKQPFNRHTIVKLPVTGGSMWDIKATTGAADTIAVEFRYVGDM